MKFYFQKGIVLTNVHLVINICQSDWLAPYIQQNEDLRAPAQIEFEKDFFKLMNNAVNGMRCEHLKNGTDSNCCSTRIKRRSWCLSFTAWVSSSSVRSTSAST